MKSLLTIILSLSLFQNVAFARHISGAVKDAENKPIENASVVLLNAKDSSVIKLGAANKNGKYDFENINAGHYIIKATAVGFTPAFSPSFEYKGDDLAVADLHLEKSATQLAAVTVTARKPLIEVKADRMVVNVEGTINATGNDALELLRRSPGVMLDKDDNISMAGKNGVQVYIDGKPSPLSGSDLANYLKSIPSVSIESIELITNPSAKYEASGNAGIINIRFKKDKSLGTNGTINAGFNAGYYSNYNGGISLNHRNKKTNLFGNYNYTDGKNHVEQTIYREQADSIFSQHSEMANRRGSHNFKAGLDYFLNKKNTVGVMVNGNISDISLNSDGPMSIAYQPTKVVDRILQTKSEINSDRKNMNFNANYKFTDNAGKELNVDADYGFYDLKNLQYLPNIYYKADGVTELYKNVYHLNAPTNIDIYSLKADYEQKLGKGKLGLGGKLGYVNTKNNFQRFNVFNNNEVFDRDRSNHFDYSENVNALYLSYNRPFKGFVLQMGLRGENTISEGRSIGEKYNSTTQSYQAFDSSTKRNYFDLFPSASVAFNKNPMNQWNISYSRRIDRPRYENLNPFEFKINDYTYSKGNTNLRPQYTNSFGISNTYKYKLTTSLNYSHVKGMFVQTFEPEGSNNYQTTRNLATQDVVSLNVSYPFVYKRFMMYNNLTSNYSHYYANFGTNRVISANSFNVQYYVQNTYKFGKKQDWTAELTGLYLSPFIWQGLLKGRSMGFVDAGLQKTILKGNGTLKASVSDIFKTMYFRGDAHYAGTYMNVAAKWQSHQFKINFTYRFGNNKVKAARQRKTGMEDESNRASGGSSSPGQ